MNKDKRKYLYLQIIAIILLGFAVYANSLKGKFIWDDLGLIKDNSYIKNWSNITEIFKSNIMAGNLIDSSFYRPIQILSYMADYSIWGLNVLGYHLTSVFLHIMVALAVYLLIQNIFQISFISFVTSALFVVHPLHTEAVAYISGRADLLSALFMLLCASFYIMQTFSKPMIRHILILTSFALALLSKEYSLITPLLLLVYSFALKKKIQVKEFISIITVSFLYIILRAWLLKISSLVTTPSANFIERLPGFFAALSEYTRLLFLPFNLHMEYGNAIFHFNDTRVALGIIILSSGLFFAMKNFKDRNLAFFAMFWFFITLLPVSNLYPLNAYMAEHWLYIPSIGFFLLLAGGLHYLYKTKRLRVVSFSLIATALFFYSYLTIRQNNYWKEPIAFFERTLKLAPGQARVCEELAQEYELIGDRARAIGYYRQAISLDANCLYAYINLGNIYAQMHKIDESIALFKKAIELNPGFFYSYIYLGHIYAQMDRIDESITLFKKAIELNPRHPMAYSNLGVVYNKIGNTKAAIEMLKKAIEVNPYYLSAYQKLAYLYEACGMREEKLELYKSAIKKKIIFDIK